MMKKWSIFLAATLMLCLALMVYWQSGTVDGEILPSSGSASENKVKNTITTTRQKSKRVAVGVEVLSQSEIRKQTDDRYEVYYDERTGIAVQYNEVMDSKGLIEIFNLIDPVKSAKFQYNKMKVYLKDGAIVMIQKNPGMYESMSRVEEAWDFIENKGKIKLLNNTSDYLKVDDAIKMRNLMDYLKSEGWAGYPSISPDNFEATFVMVTVEVMPEVIDKYGDHVKSLKVSEGYPAMFQTRSRGREQITQEHVYPEEVTVMRSFNVGLINEEVNVERNPFWSEYNSGKFIEEPTPEGIEKYGVLHKK